jgi:hypothetical protein
VDEVIRSESPGARIATASDEPRVAAWDEPRVAAWVFLPIGIATAAVGFAPWWVSGARLPLQNLWAASAPPDAMPIALLPFSQYAVIQIFSFVIVGAAVAGIAGRALRVRGWGLVLLLFGVLLVQVGATAQTSIVVREGLQDRLESTLYLGGLIAGTGLSILIGIIVTVLVARAPRAGALLGLAVGAIGMGAWTSAFFGPLQVAGGLSPLVAIVPWIPPVLTGVAIAWTGIGTAGRVIAALIALALMWVAPALTAAIASSLGSRALRDGGGDVIDYGVSVFRMALLTPELALRPILATVAVAVIGLVVRGLLARRSARPAPFSPS